MLHKKICYILLVLFFTSCDSSDTVVGTDDVDEINNVSFIVDTTYIASSVMYAKGRVKNDGNYKVQSPWYVEAQFYTDDSYLVKLGGNSTRIGVPLEIGQSTFWTLSLASSDVNVNDYPNFRVSDFRAVNSN